MLPRKHTRCPSRSLICYASSSNSTSFVLPWHRGCIFLLLANSLACYCLVMEDVFPILLRGEVFLLVNDPSWMENWHHFLPLLHHSPCDLHSSFPKYTIAFHTCKAFAYSVPSICNALPLFHPTRVRWTCPSDIQLMTSYPGPRTVLATGDIKMNYTE